MSWMFVFYAVAILFAFLTLLNLIDSAIKTYFRAKNRPSDLYTISCMDCGFSGSTSNRDTFPKLKEAHASLHPESNNANHRRNT